MKTVFKKGDNVFDISFGNGLVVSIDERKLAPYPVNVKFNCGIFAFYTIHGVKSNSLNPTLSFTEYELKGFSQAIPVKYPDIGSLCLFSDDKYEIESNLGVIRKLDRIINERYYTDIGSGWGYKYCKQIEIKEL